MKRSKYIFWLIPSLLWLGCDDILEEDISGDEVNIVAPSEGQTIEGNSVQFLWNTLDGAEDYTLQVYDGSTLVVDTTVVDIPYTQAMDAGTYEWRIKASNNAYDTQFTFPRTFEVITSLDLTGQIVTLGNPTDNLYTNDPSIIFSWDDLDAADDYVFELLKVTQSGSVTVYLEEGLTTTSIQLDASTIDEDAEYEWQVKARNASSETDFFFRTFFIDTVAPTVPSLLTPAFEEEFPVDESIAFTWNFPSDSGSINSPISSEYDISTTEDFSVILQNGTVQATNIDLTFSNAGTYYW
ncbi:MAG: hypothetical protein KTR22_07975, partial [Flavobacteriaceae bacterium]|nr:hypothetical protein [Flavobacteriaceae bacterium]